MTTTSSRDVNLIIRARDEASRALQSIAKELDTLVGKQEGLARSGPGAGASIAGMVAQLAKFEKVSGLVAAAADRSEAAISRQRSSLQENAAALAAVNAQLANAQRVISSGQQNIVSTLFRGGDASAQIAAVKAAQAEVTNLEAQQVRLSKTAAAQTTTLGEQERAFREVAAMANSAADGVSRLNAETAAQASRRPQNTLSGAQALMAGQATVDRAVVSDVTVDQVVRRTSAVKELAEASNSVSRSTAGEAAALQNLLDKANPAAAVHRKLATEIETLRGALKRGTIDAQTFAKAEAELTRQAKVAEEAIDRVGKGEKGRPTLFGMKPYELTNLGYQFNDVVSGLAMGQRPMQILAQQGGQILQLMPNVGGKITAAFSSPAFLGAAAVFGGIALSIKRAADNAKELKQIEGILEQVGKNAPGTAKELAEVAGSMKAIGLTSEQALNLIRDFMTQGLNPAYLHAFAQAAKDTASVTGGDLADAANDMRAAFAKGYDAIAELDDKLPFLTANERKQIKAMMDSGDAAAAREKAFRAYADKMSEIARKSKGEWSEAFEALGRGVDSLLNRFADTSVIQGFGNAIEAAARGIGEALTSNADADAALIQRRIDGLERVRANRVQLNSRVDTVGDPYLMMNEERELADLKARSAELEKQRNLTGDLVDADSAAAQKRRADRLAAMGDEERLTALRSQAAEQQRVLSDAQAKERAALTGRLAYQQELNASGDVEVARAKQRVAIERELGAVTKENRQVRDRARAEREREIQQFNSRVIAAEGGAARNPRSTAEGFGQFINSTWLAQFRKVFAAEAAKLSDGQILALRKNQTIAKAIIDNYARENARFLETFGAKVTAGNLYLAHFLGPAGAKRVLTANPNSPVDSLLPDAVMRANPEYLRLAGGKGRARTAGELTRFIAGRVGDTGQAQSVGQVAIADLIEESQRAQDNFNLSVQQANEERQRSIDALKIENALQGDALLLAQREIAIAKAEFDLIKQIEDANKNLKPGETPVVLDPAQVQVTRDLAAAEWDLAHARDRANAQTEDALRRKENLLAERDAIAREVAALRSAGQGKAADALVPRLRAVNAELLEAIDAAIKFYEALDPETDPLQRTREQIDAAKSGLQALKVETESWHDQLAITAEMVQNAFAGSLSDSIKGLARDIAEGKNMFESFGRAVLSFATSFAQKLADMGLESLAQKAAGSLGFGDLAGGINGVLGLGGKSGAASLDSAGKKLSGAGSQLIVAASMLKQAAAVGGANPGGKGGGGFLGLIGSTLSGLLGGGPSAGLVADVHANIAANPSIFHSGGIVGRSAVPTRAVNLSWFANAFRYHGGGIAGLRPDEVPAILQRGEEVLTRANPRHSANGGREPVVNLKNINVFDPGEVMSQAMGTEVGQRAILNFVRQNKRAWNSVLQS